MTFEEFLKALTTYYSDHHIAPGVHFAWLEEKAKFYGAVHVFPAGLQSRQVLVKSLADTLEQLVSQLYTQWALMSGKIKPNDTPK